MDAVYTPEEVSGRYHTPLLTLAQWRYKKKGPAWFRCGKRVLYRESALTAWEKTEEAPQVAERESA
jgi:hypothetical protein